MTKSITRRHKTLSAQEAERAIYIDFEGFQGQPPSLLGILMDGSLTQVVLDSRLAAAAAARKCPTATIRDVAETLKVRCEQGDRRLVAYSQHELRIFAEYAGVDFHHVYADAHKIARRWWNACRPGIDLADNSLKTFLAEIGRPCPARFGECSMTRRLRSVIDMLGKRGTYKALTPRTKAKWRDLLEYNAYDCKGMQELVVLSCNERAATQA